MPNDSSTDSLLGKYSSQLIGCVLILAGTALCWSGYYAGAVTIPVGIALLFQRPD